MKAVGSSKWRFNKPKDFLERISTLLEVSQKLLEIKSEIGRLPAGNLRVSLTEAVDEWFKTPIHSRASVETEPQSKAHEGADQGVATGSCPNRGTWRCPTFIAGNSPPGGFTCPEGTQCPLEADLDDTPF